MRLMVIAIAFSALVGALGVGHAATGTLAVTAGAENGHVVALPSAK